MGVLRTDWGLAEEKQPSSSLYMGFRELWRKSSNNSATSFCFNSCLNVENSSATYKQHCQGQQFMFNITGEWKGWEGKRSLKLLKDSCNVFSFLCCALISFAYIKTSGFWKTPTTDIYSTRLKTICKWCCTVVFLQSRSDQSGIDLRQGYLH